MKPNRLAILVLVFALIPWFAAAGSFFYPRYSQFSDLTISHLPNAFHLIQTLHDYGQIPHWSNAILGGYPFSANPLAGLWYPVGWLAYLFPQPFGFNLTVLLHILWGGVGMLIWLRKNGLRESAALLGATGFGLMPKVFAHFGAGHVSLVYAFAWTPWLLVAERERLNEGRWWLPAGVLGMIALADIRWLAYALVLWASFALWEFLAKFRIAKHRLGIGHWLFQSAGVVVGGLGLALAQLLPLVEFTRMSTRASMSTSDALRYSLPFEELLGLWIPDFGGFAEWTLYPGSLIFFLTIYVVSIPEVRKKCAFWLVVLTGGILLSLGERLPLMNIIAQLPGLDLLRVPARFYFLSGLAFAIIAAFALDDLLRREILHRPDAVFFMTPFGAFIFFLGTGMIWMGEMVSPNMLWAAACFLISVLIVSVAQRVRRDLRWVKVVFPLFLILDLSGVNAQSLSILSPDTVYNQGKSAASFLASRPGDFRIYTPSNSIPQHTAARLGIRMSNGIDPLQLQSYWDYMHMASGVNQAGYSVTLPPLEGEDVRFVNRLALPDAEKLGFLSVRYVVSEFPLTVAGLHLVFQDGDTRVYENEAFVPWVRITDNADPAGLAYPAFTRKPGYYDIHVQGAGVLTVADVDYPGWKVYLDGKETTKIRVANVLLGVNVPAGTKRVEFIFSSITSNLGAVGASATWLAWMVVALISWQRRRKIHADAGSK